MTASPSLKPLLSLSISGEMSTKASATRRRFQKLLRRNLKAALRDAGYHGQIIDSRDRIDIEGVPAEAAAALGRVFGVQGVHVARILESVAPTDIVAAGEALFADQVRGRRFAVRARRVGNTGHPASLSAGLARDLGSRLVAAGGQVDLDHPEVSVHVEVRQYDSILFSNPLPGPGGLPIGSSGRALALISGGFDSVVAAWQMLMRGLELDFVLFDLAGAEQVRGVGKVLGALKNHWLAGSRARLFIVDFRAVVADLRTHVPGQYWQVMLKRLMLRGAERLAARSHAHALVTGEALAQVSSQTLANLAAIEAHAGMPVLRPLIGMNKDGILQLARHIGTWEASSGNVEFCALDGGRPSTGARTADIDRLEAGLDAELLARVVDEAVPISREHFDSIGHDDTSIDFIPEAAAILDLRHTQAWARWHRPGSIQLDFDDACRFADHLPRDRHYLLVCEYGLKSAWLANAMRQAGFEAHSLSGGIDTLRRLTPEEPEAGSPA